MMQNPRGEGAKRKEELPIGSSSPCIRSSFSTVVLSAAAFVVSLTVVIAHDIGIIIQLSV